MYTGRERILRTLGGEPVDRPAWMLWRHYYEEEQTAQGLANAMLGWQERWGFDGLKVNARSHYYGEGWGAVWELAGDPPRPRRVRYPVQTVEDWDKIEPLNPRQGAFGEHVEAVRLIRRRLPEDVMLIHTVFLPFAITGRLLVDSPRTMADHLRTDPQRVHHAVKAITETWIDFVRLLREEGVDGIFFATTPFMASLDIFPEHEYAEFGRPYDLQVISAVEDLSFNVLHVCGLHVMLNALADYPVAALNWETTDPRNIGLGEALSRYGKAIIGGLTHRTSLKRPTIATGTPAEVLAEAGRAASEAAGRRWILGAGCVTPAETPDENIEALRQALPALSQR